MDTVNQMPEVQKSEQVRRDDDKNMVAVPDEFVLSEKLVPELCDEIIVSCPEEAKEKVKQTDDVDDPSDVETERIGMDIGSPSLSFDSDTISGEGTLEIDLEEIDLIASHIGQGARSQTTRSRSLTSQHSEDEEERDVKENGEPLLVLRDPVRVRRHDYMARDVAGFLLNYPRRMDDPDSTANVRFYNNEIRFRPYGILIDDFHTRAFRRFKLLEEHHGCLLLRYSANLTGTFNGYFQLENKV